MKTYELQEGSYVMSNKGIIQIDAIVDVEDDYPIDQSNLVIPIELTNKMLVQNGFKKVEPNIFLAPADDLFLREDSNIYQVTACIDSNKIEESIQYVHELQNIYSMFLNKELKLIFN